MATLSVAPGANPVVFTPSRVTETRTVTVTWDTGLSAGRVGRRIDGGHEHLFGSGRAGSADTDIGLNQTHTFTLRSGVGQVLATLVVTTVLETADLPLRPIHRIDVTRAVVGEDSVQLRWRTSRPVACWAEIRTPGRNTEFAWTDEGAVHHVRFEGLQPDTDHSVRILPAGGTSHYLGSIHTGRRGDHAEVEAGTWTPDPEMFRQLRLRTIPGPDDALRHRLAAEAGADAGVPDAIGCDGRGLVVTVMSADGTLRLRHRSEDGTWCAWADLGTVLPPGSHAVHWEADGVLAVTSVDADNLVRVLVWRDPPRPSGRGDWVTVGTLAGVERALDTGSAR